MRGCCTIIMLFLPIPAIAETFVCTTETNSFLSDSVSNVFDSSNGEGWVVDTDLGFRKLKVDKDDYRGTNYRGGCQKTELTVSCTFGDLITLEHILMDRMEGSYTYSQHSLGGAVFSSLGSCNEI